MYDCYSFDWDYYNQIRLKQNARQLTIDEIRNIINVLCSENPPESEIWKEIIKCSMEKDYLRMTMWVRLLPIANFNII
jgi:hypothetical protein